MKKRIIISESERESILSQHKHTIKNVSESKKQSLSEREMSKLITNVLMNESPSNFNKNLLTELNFCNVNICASQGYATGTCNYFGNGTGNCVFADGSVCGWTTGSEAGGGEFAQWTSGPCGMSTQGGTRPSKLPKPTTTTTTPKPVSDTTTTMKESIVNRLFRKVLSEIESEKYKNRTEVKELEGCFNPTCSCKSDKECPKGKKCINNKCGSAREPLKELEGCFNPTCSCKSDKECTLGKKCINGKCTPVTNREMKEVEGERKRKIGHLWDRLWGREKVTFEEEELDEE